MFPSGVQRYSRKFSKRPVLHKASLRGCTADAPGAAVSHAAVAAAAAVVVQPNPENNALLRVIWWLLLLLLSTLTLALLDKEVSKELCVADVAAAAVSPRQCHEDDLLLHGSGTTTAMADEFCTTAATTRSIRIHPTRTSAGVRNPTCRRVMMDDRRRMSLFVLFSFLAEK
eukprot:scaffold5314_cov167-Amphora_coffeaeformis.AAC.1